VAIIGLLEGDYLANRLPLLAAAALRLGHAVRPITYDQLVITTRGPRVEVADARGSLEGLDALGPVLLSSLVPMSLALASWAEETRRRTLNRVEAMVRANDKATTHRLWTAVGLPQPDTIMASDFTILAQAAAELGYPVVAKLGHGGAGRYVRLARDRDELRLIVEAWQNEQRPYQPVLVQRYLPAGRTALRAMVLDGQIIAATERTAPAGEFRSNVAVGGTVRPVKLRSSEQALALTAAATIGLRWAGVDLVRTGSRTELLEINAYPGLDSEEAASGQDLSAQVIGALVR
jgi:ribosomal protein S6--L-glutamate ligase